MQRSKSVLCALSLAAAGALALAAYGRPIQAKRAFIRPNPVTVDFALINPTIGVGRAPTTDARKRSLAGSSIAVFAGDSIVIDGDSGKLVRTDAKGNVTDRLTIGKDATQLAVDQIRKRAYVADRDGDRIVVVDLAKGLKQVASYATSTEPYGVALTPDGDTLLVTTVADKQLMAFDTEKDEQRWSIEIGPDARGVAVSPNGKHALVTFVRTGVFARVKLAAEPNDKPKIKFTALNPTQSASAASSAMPQSIRGGFDMDMEQSVSATGSSSSGRGFARGGFAATFVGHDIAIVPHQISTPQQVTTGFEVRGSYGGGGSFNPPIVHRAAFVGAKKVAMAQLGLHQPRAMAYDPTSDTLYIAGYGSDDVMALAEVSQPTVNMKWKQSVQTSTDTTVGCGPSGLAIDGDEVKVFCSLQRKIVTLSDIDTAPKVAAGESLTTSRWSDSELRGKSLFRQGNNAQLSTLGAMACESCHPETRADGLSWRIEGMALQTPLIGGRIAGTHPYKWNGGDKDIQTSLRSTVVRLGGTGISKQQAEDLSAFLEASERPRKPHVASKRAVAHGKKIFESKETGCTKCHQGAMLTNGKSYELADDLPKVDTPSLLGLAASAPYYHDGSAATLRALLLENGTIHGMGKVSHLEETEVDDLIAYLEQL